MKTGERDLIARNLLSSQNKQLITYNEWVDAGRPTSNVGLVVGEAFATALWLTEDDWVGLQFDGESTVHEYPISQITGFWLR